MNDSRVFVDTNIFLLYTEDLQNGQIIEKSLKIVNPFVS